MNKPLYRKLSSFKLRAAMAAVLALAISASAGFCAVITQTLSSDVYGPGHTFSFNQFDTNLGVLTGVTLTLSGSDRGSFSATNSGSVVGNVSRPTDYLSVAYHDGSFNVYTSAVKTLTTNPSTSGTGYQLAIGAQQTFNMTGNDTVVSLYQDSILSDYWSAYEGTGLVSFTATHAPNITFSGDIYTLNSQLLSTYTTMTLDYTYEIVPVPEASQVASSVVALAGVGVVYVRRRSRGIKAA